MVEPDTNYKKEFDFTEDDFVYLSRLAGEIAGIKLSEAKKELVYGRLSKRLRALGLKKFKDYCDLLRESDDAEEFTHFINAITTNVTSFFRENHHFEFLANTLLPELIRRSRNGVRPQLRIWSAGCSTGKEPYSIAIVLREVIQNIDLWDAKILATDLDSNVLAVGRQGSYLLDKVNELSEQRLKKWFVRDNNDGNNMIRVNKDLRKMITFNQLNLTSSWPIKGQFDAIFCRNVTIYFDRETRVNLLDRFANHLKDGGYLFVGHSESLFGLSTRFETVGRTIHRKIA